MFVINQLWILVEDLIISPEYGNNLMTYGYPGFLVGINFYNNLIL